MFEWGNAGSEALQDAASQPFSKSRLNICQVCIFGFQALFKETVCQRLWNNINEEACKEAFP